MRLTAVVLAVLVAVLAGCGGSSSKSLSKSEYVARADAICKVVDDKNKAIGSPQSTAEVKSAADQLVPVMRDAMTKLRALPAPPDAIKADVTAVYAYLDRSIGKVDEL